MISSGDLQAIRDRWKGAKYDTLANGVSYPGRTCYPVFEVHPGATSERDTYVGTGIVVMRDDIPPLLLEIKRLHGIICRIQSACGAPDSAEACRNVLGICKEAMG